MVHYVQFIVYVLTNPTFKSLQYTIVKVYMYRFLYVRNLLDLISFAMLVMHQHGMIVYDMTLYMTTEIYMHVEHCVSLNFT